MIIIAVKMLFFDKPKKSTPVSTTELNIKNQEPNTNYT
jgi:hypothetical protein